MDAKTIRRRKSYHLFEDLYEALTTLPLPEQLQRIHEILDKNRAYGYDWYACAAQESLDQFLKDKELCSQKKP